MPEISKTPGPDPISKRLTQLRKRAGSGGPFALELKLAGQVERDLADADSSLIPIRIAILAAHTLDHFIKVLVTRLKLAGFAPEVFVSEFGVIAQSVFDRQSSLYAFNPDIIWVFSTHRDLKLQLEPMATIERVEQLIEATILEQKSLVEQIQSYSNAVVILNNTDLPVTQALGNYQGSVPWSDSGLFTRYNLNLPQYLPSSAVIFDLCAVSSFFGHQKWVDERYWHHSKHAFSFDAYGVLAHRISRLIAAIKGRSAKCLVLDLDNTLWGGVIGDDGLEGIDIGEDAGADGEAFSQFQHYIKALKTQGVILALCSKNTQEMALKAISDHPDMILRVDDFAAIRINWQDKATNLLQIAEEINIRPDALVFFDDNPAERGLVRELMPEIWVPEVSDDPSDYVRILDSMRYFEMVSLNQEDMQRATFYKANKQRAQLKASFTDLSSYLKSLEMLMTVTSATGVSRNRAVQLLNRTNQFNLDGAKMSETEMDHYLDKSEHYCLCFRLEDRFGDNGIISVMLFRIHEQDLIIDHWVMSCRVLARGVEDRILGLLNDIACARGLNSIIGHWRASGRNDLVKDLYQTHGFKKTDFNDGAQYWKMSTTPETGKVNNTIELNLDLHACGLVKSAL